MDLYEQKYKKALEKLQEAFAPEEDGCKISGLTRGCIENIFPELKDSEDEKIRKDILCYFEHYAHDIKGADVQKWLDWLEKQGEKINPYSGMSFEYNGHIWGMCARDNGVDILLDKQLFKHLEQQGEQTYAELCQSEVTKTSDQELEPKFKVGDWISGYYTNYKVTAIHSKGYVVENTDGTKINILFENEKSHHLWTIQDAEDGDVLSGEIDGEVFVFLFNQIQDRWIVAHVYYSETDGEFIEKAYLHRYHSFSPATKEQHNLLFQKMKEAGYEWDAEKKELKKIESKTFNEWLDEYNKRRKNAK